jgi:hypothetical protein
MRAFRRSANSWLEAVGSPIGQLLDDLKTGSQGAVWGWPVFCALRLSTAPAPDGSNPLFETIAVRSAIGCPRPLCRPSEISPVNEREARDAKALRRDPLQARTMTVEGGLRL